MHHLNLLGIGFAVLLFCSCSHGALHEAQHVVAQADSLRAEGKIYTDSASLAQAYSTLGLWQWRYATDFVHACYHYGRMLRGKDNPEEAMRVFIRASHARSNDYHMLGRVYSNMGSICHIACDYPMSYKMYERSAGMFMSNRDTLLYYHGLNSMAYELAEQGKKEEAFSLIAQINEQCHDSYVLEKTIETKAEACLCAKQYDSALYYTSQLLSSGYYEPNGLLIRAQSYSLTGKKDSAVYYANIILSLSTNLYDQCNALYILTNDDDTKNISSVRETAADRADTQKIIETERSKLAQAVLLLEQDIEKGFNWILCAVILAMIICMIALIVVAQRWVTHNRRTKQQIKDIGVQQAEDIIKSIQQHIDVSDINRTLNWKEYTSMKAEVDLYMRGIVSKLEACNLNETEIRFCVLLLLDFSLNKIAETIHYSYPSGIKTLKKRISDKLKTTPPHLKEHLLSM